MTPKDKKIIEDSERLGIPIFVLTAKDKCAIEALKAYLHDCEDEGCSMNHLTGIKIRMNDFINWETSNPDKLKLPD